MRPYLPLTLISILVAVGCVAPQSEPDIPKSEPWLVGQPETTEPRQVDEGVLGLSASPTKEGYSLGEPRELERTRAALSINLAFGGATAALVLARDAELFG